MARTAALMGILCALPAACRTARGEPGVEAADDIDALGPAEQGLRNPAAVERFLRGELYAASDRAGEAAAELRAAVAANPKDPYLRAELARALVRSGELGAARRLIDGLTADGAARAAAWIALAELAKAESEPMAAEAGAVRILERDPAHREAALWLADVRLRRGDPAGAEAILARFLAAAPDDAAARLARGEARLARGDIAGARMDHERSAALRPDRTLALAPLARACEAKTADAPSCAALLELALAGERDDPALRERLVRVLLDLGLAERAARHIDSLPAVEPGDAEAAVGRARMLLAAGRPYDARSLLAALPGEGPAAVRVRLTLAEAEIALLRFEAAALLLPTDPSGLGDAEREDVLRLRERIVLRH